MRAICLGVIVSAFAASAFAAPITLDTLLTPVSGTGSTGSGSFTGTFDTSTDTLAFTLTWTNLTTSMINAHIHLASTPGGTGGVLIPFFAPGAVETINPAPPALPLGTSGTLTESITITDPTTLSEFLSGSAAGLLYVNVHSTIFPAGEIRGDLPATILTPEPGTIGLLAFGLVGLAGFSRWRKTRSLTNR